jgi:transcriptional repressor NrdR
METKVVDSRTIDEWQAIRRRRECEYCSHRFTTFERKEVTELTVVKKDWTKEMYDKQKLKRAIILAFAKRKYNSEEIENMINILETKRSQKWTEITSKQIGTDVLNAIKNIDLVAYVRFASVYNSFETTQDFEKLLHN